MDAPLNYVGTFRGVDMGVKQRLLRHLEQCAGELDLDFRKCNVDDEPKSDQEEFIRPDSSTAPQGDENNNHNRSSPPPSRPERILKTIRRLPQKRTLLQDVSTKYNSKKAITVPGETDAEGGEEKREGELGGKGQFSLLQVIPTRLPDGQVVFLLPNNSKGNPLPSLGYPQNVYYIASSSSPSSESATPPNRPFPDEPLDFTLRRREDPDDNVWRPW